jgi:hypothetical protein
MNWNVCGRERYIHYLLEDKFIWKDWRKYQKPQSGNLMVG